MQQEVETKTRDYGTAELHRQHIVEKEGGTARVRTSIPIDYYKYQGWITIQQWEAAELLYVFWYYGAEKSMHSSMKDPRLPRGVGNAMKREEMEQAYNRAIASIRSLPMRLVIYNVVCLGEWARSDMELAALKMTNKKHYLEALDEKVGKNRRMTLLRDGLDILARHFKIPQSNEDNRRA